ncbi:STAS domain-containing protein [Streptomyces sp. NPDC046866]|uniref:STAS domain-containing protein n=1 Tax=Streptomyces sp. NPDC046866 TaxID=3154921 RepID=UPI0034516F06
MAARSQPDAAVEAHPAARVLVTVEGLPPGRFTALVAGEITEGSLARLRRSLTAALDSSSGGLDLDLSDVGFCDITGLHLLLELRARATATGRSLSVTALSPALLRLLRATGCAGRLIGTDAAAAGSLLVTAELRRALAATGTPWSAARWAPGDCLRIRIHGDAATVTWPVARGSAGAGAEQVLYEAVASALHRAGLHSVRHRAAQARSVRSALFGPRGLTRTRRA